VSRVAPDEIWVSGPANFFGVGGFSYQLIDPSGEISNRVNVFFEVAEVNDNPTTGEDKFTTREGEPIRITVETLMSNDEDVDIGDVISFVSVQNPQVMTVLKI